MMLNFSCFLSKPSCFMLLCFLPCKAHSPVQLADIWSPPKTISLHGLVCVSHTQNPQDSLIFLPYYVIVLCYLFLGPPYCGLYSHYSSQSALAKTQNDLWFAKSKALPLELSLFDTTVVFDTVSYVLVLELSLYSRVVGSPYRPHFPPPPRPVPLANFLSALLNCWYFSGTILSPPAYLLIYVLGLMHFHKF